MYEQPDKKVYYDPDGYTWTGVKQGQYGRLMRQYDEHGDVITSNLVSFKYIDVFEKANGLKEVSERQKGK